MKGKQSRDKRVRVPEHRKVLIIFAIIFTIYSLSLIFVFGWIFINSFKTKEQYLANLWSAPDFTYWANYIDVWTFGAEQGQVTLLEMFKNSMVLCLLLPTIGAFVTSFAAYALAKFKFKLNRFIYFLHILPMMFTVAGTQATVYLLLDKFHLVNNILGLVLMGAGGGGMNFLLLYGTYKNVSDTYMEAAEIDGAGDFRTYFQIMLPQAFGIIGTIWMFGFITTWNDYATINLFLNEMPTVAVGIETLREQFVGNINLDYPKYYAAIILSMVPVILLFVAFQEQIMQLSLGGGIKG